MFLIFITETDEGHPRPKYIFNKMWNYLLYLLFRGLVHHHNRVLHINDISLKKRPSTFSNISPPFGRLKRQKQIDDSAPILLFISIGLETLYSTIKRRSLREKLLLKTHLFQLNVIFFELYIIPATHSRVVLIQAFSFKSLQ